MKTNLTYLIAALALGATISFSLLATSCSKKSIDSDQAKKFVDAVLVAEPGSDINPDSLNLYVDYSTCVSSALQSPFFQDVRPSILSSKPRYFSIKGNKIAREKGNVYDLLTGITNVNYADIKSAANQIVKDKRQAILITDAEYWPETKISGDRHNDPYMKSAIENWLAKGRDIYIYEEPYMEGKFAKHRYYFFFTDDRLADTENYHKKFQKSVGSPDGINIIHLTAKAPKLIYPKDIDEIVGNDAAFNYNFDVKAQSAYWDKGVNLYSYALTLDQLKDILKDENKAGKEIQLPLIGGLELAKDKNAIFEIEDIDLRVYDMTPNAEEFFDVKTDPETGEEIPNTPNINFPLVKDVLEIDEDEFKKSGKINLMIDDFEKADLDPSQPALLRVDIIVDDAKSKVENGSPIQEALTWESIKASNAGAANTSLYQSVRRPMLLQRHSSERDSNKESGKETADRQHQRALFRQGRTLV